MLLLVFASGTTLVDNTSMATDIVKIIRMQLVCTCVYLSERSVAMIQIPIIGISLSVLFDMSSCENSSSNSSEARGSCTAGGTHLPKSKCDRNLRQVTSTRVGPRYH